MAIRQKFVFRPGWLCLEPLGRCLKNACGVALAVSMLLAVPASFLASETRGASQPLDTGTLTVPGGAVADETVGLDVVRVEPKGWSPKGFRYRVVLGPTSRGVASSCELTAAEGGLLVIARDVDGIGNDLDLIIKSARSFVPVGVWINDHRGGFIKADSRAYAQFIFSEVPMLLSGNSLASVQPAGLPSHSFCICPLARSCPFEQLLREVRFNSTNFAFWSRLAAGPHQTRAPPLPLSARLS
jgi:hypothetical protein